MPPERQREIASKGGKAAHEMRRAHEFTSSTARSAGRKGGEIVSEDRQHMADIGRRGGYAAAQSKKEKAAQKARVEKEDQERKEREERWGKT